MTYATLAERVRALTDEQLVDRYEAAKVDPVLKVAFDAEMRRRGL